ncbi:LysR substrate-binding domain-containing protein [Myxococcota bacterium]|nr:LysR substrate-binding domain-containing protein [Myxococcota bacterium]
METQVDLQLLATFSAVAEQSSFSKAAAKLGVAKGTVSRSIAQLEALLGVELVHRTTHHVSLSTAGAALYERTRGHLHALRTAVVDLPEREEAPSGLLRMAAPPDFGAMVLPSVIAAFSRRFPGVRFDIRLSGQQVDLVKDGYDLAIRVVTGPLEDSTLTARRIGKSTGAFYAAPSYVARRGRPKQLQDERHTWVLHRAFARVSKVAPGSAQFIVDDFLLARDLMRDGVGVGVLPSFVARAYVREGLLEEVPVSGAATMAGELVMLYPSSGQTPKKVTAFRDFVVEHLRSTQ